MLKKKMGYLETEPGDMRGKSKKVLSTLVVSFFIASLFLSVLMVVPDNASAIVTIIDEPGNPVFPTRCGESSMIMDGDQMDVWFASGLTLGAFGYHSLWYAHSHKADLGTFSTPQKVLDGIRFPTVVKDGSTYYCFTSKGPPDGKYGIYLYSSTDKTTWTPMNSGNPILPQSTNVNSQWNVTWNPGVVVVGGVFHMFVECATQAGSVNQNAVRLGYTHSTMAAMNWNGNKTEDNVIDMGGSPCPVYVPDRNAILLLYARLDVTWHLEAALASAVSDLSQTSSWTTSLVFSLSDNGADPAIVNTGDDAEYPVTIQWFHGQPIDSDIYQEYSALNFTDFYDAVLAAASAWSPTFTSSPVLTGNVSVFYSYEITLNESGTVTGINMPSWLSLLNNGTQDSVWWLNGTPTGTGGSYNIKTKAYSTAGLHYSYQNWTLVIAVVLHFTSSPVTEVTNPDLYYYAPTTNIVCTFTMSTNATWLFIDAATGIVNGTPPTATSHEPVWFVVNITATNGGNHAYQVYTLWVFEQPAYKIVLDMIPTILIVVIGLFFAWLVVIIFNRVSERG